MTRIGVAYEIATGRIAHALMADGMGFGPALAGTASMEVAGIASLEAAARLAATHYVQDGVLMERPTMGASVGPTAVVADGVAEVVLTVPVGATAEIIGPAVRFTADLQAGATALTFDHPGTYQIVIEQWPFRRWEAGVTAYAP